MVGDPVFGKNFLNRTKELELLENYLKEFIDGQRTNIAVIGLRKIGKTSLFLEFQRRNNLENIFCSLIILPKSEKLSSFIRDSVETILRNLMNKLFPEIRTETLDIRSMANIIETKYPRLSYRCISLIEESKKEPKDSFDKLFDLFKLIKTETNLNVIIILDEFQNISEYEVSMNELLDIFRKKVMLNKEVWYLISGSAIRMLLRITANINQPNFEHFYRIELDGFDYEHSKRLITNFLGTNVEIGESTLSFLYDLTDGTPFYLGIICQSLKNSLIEQKFDKVENNVLSEVLIKELYSSSGRLYNYFENTISQSLESRGKGVFLEILKAISRNFHRPNEICKEIRIPLSSFPSFIKRLMELSLVEKFDSGNSKGYAYYDLKDSLLKYWLKNVYSVKNESSIRDIKTSMTNFKESVKEIMSIQNAEISKGYESRVRELFKKFEDFSFKDILFTKFDKVDHYETPKGEVDILAEINNKYFLAEVFNEHVNKKELFKLLDKIDYLIKEEKKEIISIIIVSLKTIDREVIEEGNKLGIKFLEKKDINQLLKKYSMPRLAL